MTTPRDLLITTLDVTPTQPPGQGDFSLALAGAELIDLLNARAARLDGDHIAPGENRAISDVLLNEAASSLTQEGRETRDAPYEAVEDWLWRRGRGLAAGYFAALTSEGQIALRRRSRWIPVGTSRTVLTDTPARSSALERWTSDEPVLTSLGAAIGIRDQRLKAPRVADEAVATVLDAVHDAVRDLEAERQRRSIEDAAFDSIWRGL
ncbi:GPP34 family phosphoprotein [Streptomyces niveus]|uniref:GPP34 family phosphoprotein n=1 Tax=Streptomyces niveus TaxID=193462 RepID=UPI0036D2EBDA